MERGFDELEALVDRTSLHRIVSGLSEICALKADHINETWQDAKLARHWEYAGQLLAALAEKKPVKGL